MRNETHPLDQWNALQESLKQSRAHSTALMELCEHALALLPDVVPRLPDVPRSLPCRDLLIQALAARDEFEQARHVVERAADAGAYQHERKQAALDRIDEMEKARDAVHAAVEQHPGLSSRQAALEALRSSDAKAAEWYIQHSRTIRRLPGSAGYALSFPTAAGSRTLNAAVVDVETTGMSKAADEVVEIGVMLCRVDEASGEITEILEEVNNLHQPSFPIPPGVIKVHGIRDRDVAGKEMDAPRLRRLFAETDVLIAHNASFDRGFVQKYFPETGRMTWRCSVKNVAWKQYGFPTKKLLDLCRRHGITDSQNHRALDDVKLTVRLLQEQNPEGEYYMKELLPY
ncbi:exonuclease domain-containing protein [Salibacterium halotolerans]|uniref:Exonuclease n=1 Tax=Salibacterium halotolerans TaxID=1884432 RepID=A0A1I5Y800_9BACI|nr:exonuclease domain-containing protein [Salibacterium halotolerans]SFQ40345.1 Exonuclease [Salibacterium halotolerans]